MLLFRNFYGSSRLVSTWCKNQQKTKKLSLCFSVVGEGHAWNFAHRGYSLLNIMALRKSQSKFYILIDISKGVVPVADFYNTEFLQEKLRAIHVQGNNLKNFFWCNIFSQENYQICTTLRNKKMDKSTNRFSQFSTNFTT